MNQQAKEGAKDSAEFALLVEEQSRLLYRIALAVARHPQDAEDAVQEAFLQLYRTRHWQRIADHRSYLARIAWRTAVRQRSKRPYQELSATFASLDRGPEAAAIDRQFEGHLHGLVDQLSEKLRIPLALSSLGELKLVEIAKILGLPEGTVRRRIHTARQLLKQKLNAAERNKL